MPARRYKAREWRRKRRNHSPHQGLCFQPSARNGRRTGHKGSAHRSSARCIIKAPGQPFRYRLACLLPKRRRLGEVGTERMRQAHLTISKF